MTDFTKESIDRLNVGDRAVPETWNPIFDQIENNLDQFFTGLGTASQEDLFSDGGIIPETDKENVWDLNQSFLSSLFVDGELEVEQNVFFGSEFKVQDALTVDTSSVDIIGDVSISDGNVNIIGDVSIDGTTNSNEILEDGIRVANRPFVENSAIQFAIALG